MATIWLAILLAGVSSTEAADVCSEYKLRSFCEKGDYGIQPPNHASGCQWCGTSQASGAECIAANATCSSQPVPEVMSAIGVKAWHNERQVLQLMADSKRKTAAESGSSNRAARAPATQNILEGLFVRPCQHYGTAGSDNLDISEFDTRRYNHCNGGQACTYELDRTYYVGDPHCVPNASDVFYKLNLHGNITYHGENENFPGTYKAQMQWVGATIFINGNGYYKNIVNTLNACCPNVAWKTDTWMSVQEGDCTPVSTNADNVCNLVSGATDYFNYKWTDDNMHYITSRDDFNPIQGWANPVDPGYLRERIEESGNNNAEDCDLPLWNKCGDMITTAEVNCQSCGSSDASERSNLECEGCLFRELNPDGTWDPASSTNNWHTCCPCVAHYAETVEKVWLKHSVKNC